MNTETVRTLDAPTGELLHQIDAVIVELGELVTRMPSWQRGAIENSREKLKNARRSVVAIGLAVGGKEE